MIDTGFPHKRKVKDFFVQFKDIEDCHVGQWRAYWGMITDADPSIEYLNSGGRNAASIVLKTDIRQGIMNKYGTDNSEDFAGCYALVFGRLKKSARGKKCIYPHGIQWICLNIPQHSTPGTLEQRVENSAIDDHVENSQTVPVCEVFIHPHDNSSEVCQVGSMPQGDIAFSETALYEGYETSRSEEPDAWFISGEPPSAGKDIAHLQELSENCTTSEHLKASPRGRITAWLRAIIFWKK